MKKISTFFVFLSLLILGNLAFLDIYVTAEELILKVKENPTIAGWVYQKGKLENSYCLYERNYMILASANVDIHVQNPILNIFKEHEADILSSNFSISNRRFVSLDSNGMLIERMFDDISKVNVRKVHEKLKPASVAISPDDSMELVGFKNGFVQSHSLLKKAKKNVDVYFKAHSSSVYSISFNALGNYFVTSGADGKIKIWQTKNLSLIREMDAFIKKDEISVPAIFSPLNDVFVYASAEKMLAFSDIQGKNINTVFIADGIEKVHFTGKKDTVAVLTSLGNIEFYSISKGKYLGTIPSLNEFSIYSLSINIITGSILVATKEGEIYLCASKEIQNVRVAKKNGEKQETVIREKTPKIAKQPKAETEETFQLSENVLEYWGLEDGVYVERVLRKPFFPIKDETPLEEPMVVLPAQTKEIKKTKKVILPAKTLDQTVFDEEVEFQSIQSDEEDEEYEEDSESDINDTENNIDKEQQEEDSPQQTVEAPSNNNDNNNEKQTEESSDETNEE